jgi:guanidinopropionase
MSALDDAARRSDRLHTFRPVSGMTLPRFAGIATFMRLPYLDPAEAGRIDIGLLGIPFDGATTNRPGARHGPRGVREASSLMRLVNGATLVAPYELCACADLGDVPVNPNDISATLRRIETFVASLAANRVTPLAVGGDHIVSYPILRALGRGRPLGMIHIDAHSDTGDVYFGVQRLTHGTPFRRAIEDGVLDPTRTVQIGLRGTLYARDERDWARGQGVRIIDMEEAAERGISSVIAEARDIIGGPAYFSFDVDALDPAFAPGTGTPEVGGFTTREALQLVRGFRHLDLVGADVVEVSPPLDPSGNTALVGATIAFELLCLLAEARVSSPP